MNHLHGSRRRRLLAGVLLAAAAAVPVGSSSSRPWLRSSAAGTGGCRLGSNACFALHRPSLQTEVAFGVPRAFGLAGLVRVRWQRLLAVERTYPSSIPAATAATLRPLALRCSRPRAPTSIRG